MRRFLLLTLVAVGGGCGTTQLPPCTSTFIAAENTVLIKAGQMPAAFPPCIKPGARAYGCVCGAGYECVSLVLEGCFREHACIPFDALECPEGMGLKIQESCPPHHSCVVPP